MFAQNFEKSSLKVWSIGIISVHFVVFIHINTQWDKRRAWHLLKKGNELQTINV